MKIIEVTGREKVGCDLSLRIFYLHPTFFPRTLSQYRSWFEGLTTNGNSSSKIQELARSP